MAKVATTNGRLKMWERPWRRDRRDTKVPPTFLFGFTDLVFQSDHFWFHLAKSDVLTRSAGFVKQINHSAGKTAKENNEKPERADENRFCFRHAAKAVQHNLQNFFAKAYSRETDR